MTLFVSRPQPPAPPPTPARSWKSTFETFTARCPHGLADVTWHVTRDDGRTKLTPKCTCPEPPRG